MFYIATFFSHFGAIRYKKLCEQQGIAAKAMPIPRDLSSSCEERYVEPSGVCASEIDQIVRAEPEGYVRVYQAKERNDGN